ncbi:hypothetical protein [Pedobacter panaciterrae]
MPEFIYSTNADTGEDVYINIQCIESFEGDVLGSIVNLTHGVETKITMPISELTYLLGDEFC